MNEERTERAKRIAELEKLKQELQREVEENNNRAELKKKLRKEEELLRSAILNMELIQLEQQVNIHKQIVEAMKEQVQLAQEKEVAELECKLERENTTLLLEIQAQQHMKNKIAELAATRNSVDI